VSTEPFSFTVRIARIPPGGKHFRVAVSEEQRKRIATVLGIVEVADLTAELDVRPSGGGGFAVTGTLYAGVVQTDVVMLEPVRQEMREEIDLILMPADANSRRGRAPVEGQAPDVRDVYLGNEIDLGAIILEHLALGLDPYPRSPGVEFSGHFESNPSDSTPFSALAKLKPNRE
jgi:hypothetical protein